MPQAAAPSTLQIFKPGRFVSMSGETFAFSEADLAATAKAYDPALHEAPLVVGHPKHDGPAYGWVRSVAFSGGALEAQPADVDPSFAEMVGRKAFKNMSASFYAPDAPGNPVPGVYYLRHVGFLGAVPPAVRGLRSPSFSSSDAGVVEFSEWDDVTNAGLWRRLREWFIGRFGLDEADKALPAYLVQDLERSAQDEVREAAAEAATSQPAATAASFSEPNLEDAVSKEQLDALAAENARLKAQLDASNATQRQTRLAGKHAEHVAFAAQLVSEGRLATGRAGAVTAVLDLLAEQEETSGQAVAFGEGEARAPLASAVKDLLTAVPPSVEFSEVATAGRATDGGGRVVDFAAPAGAVVDPTSAAIHRKVKAYQTAHPGTDYVAALDAVQAGRT